MQSAIQEEELCRLVHQINRDVIKCAGFDYHSGDISYGRLLALNSVQLGNNSMTEIAGDLQIALPTATVLVKKLVLSGLVSRLSDNIDRRVIKIALTKKGKAVLETTQSIKLRCLKKYLAKLTTADKKVLISIMKKLISQ